MIRVSYHAIQQYISRLDRKTNDPEQEILDLYHGAEKESSDNSGLVKRRMKYLDDAEYYKNGNWRLVVLDHTIVTVEKDSFDYSGLGFYKQDKKRSKKAWKWTKKNR